MLIVMMSKYTIFPLILPVLLISHSTDYCQVQSIVSSSFYIWSSLGYILFKWYKVSIQRHFCILFSFAITVIFLFGPTLLLGEFSTHAL